MTKEIEFKIGYERVTAKVADRTVAADTVDDTYVTAEHEGNRYLLEIGPSFDYEAVRVEA